MQPTLHGVLGFGLGLLIARPLAAEETRLRRIAPDEASKTAAAVVVEGTTPLVHTTQVLPLDARGEVIGPGSARAQAEAVLDRLEAALRDAGSGLDRLVRVQVYAARPEAVPVFREAFARRMADRGGPALGLVVGALADPRALLAVDAVAATSLTTRPGVVTRLASPALAGQRTGGHLAILPAGGRVHVSGQAEPGADPAEATRRTLEGLDKTLAFLKLDRTRVVQLKAFLGPMTSADLVEREVVAFFGADAVPTLSLVEWRSNLPIEIELIAAADPSEGGEAIEYLTPPGLKASPIFSRVAKVNRGDWIYISEVFGPPTSSGGAQVEAIFDSLGKVLAASGGDFRHLVKATYFVVDDEASPALNDLRPRYYDPARPPAASKAMVAGVGEAGRTVGLDMIAVSSPTPAVEDAKPTIRRPRNQETDMRLGLIGSTGHWQTYASALKRVPGLQLVAVAAAGPEETTGAFDHAPGLALETRRYDDAGEMLDRERLDVVQVSCRNDRIPHWARIALERGLPVMAEKPLAMDLPTLEGLFRASEKSKAALVPMHTMRNVPELAAVARAVRAGEIGEPLLSFSQKTYKWGKARPDFYRSRATFPGLVPWVGIHALDWLHWILGDVFTEVQGREGTAHPDYPACGSHAAFVLSMKDGGVASLTLDFLRPQAAPTHADERVRIAGSRGVIETALVEKKVTLIGADTPPRTLPTTAQADIFTQFARSLRGESPPPLTLRDGCRITEIAIKAQQAADTGRVVSLLDSPYHMP